MQTIRAVPSKQDLRATLDSTGAFNLITDDIEIQFAFVELILLKIKYKTAAMNNPTNQA